MTITLKKSDTVHFCHLLHVVQRLCLEYRHSPTHAVFAAIFENIIGSVGPLFWCDLFYLGVVLATLSGLIYGVLNVHDLLLVVSYKSNWCSREMTGGAT